MSKMTLDQVRDWHRSQARSCGLHEHLQDEGKLHDDMADAIDAELKRQASAQGEAVAFAIVGKGEAELVFARDVLHDKRGMKSVARELGEGKHPLYAHPAERAGVPKGWKLVPIEPTDEMYNAVADARQESPMWLSDEEVWAAMLGAVPSEAKP